MKHLFKPLLLVIPIIAAACGSPERENRDAEATQIIDSISDTTARANAITADVNLNGDEKTFLLAAATGGMMEVEAANLAIQLSKNEVVKSFAQMMLADHTKANKDLAAIVAAKGMKLPTTLSEENQTHLAALKKLSGKQFEEQYMTMMINDHAKTVKLFSEGSVLQDSSLKSFAGKTLPVIAGHYKEAVKIGKTLNLSHAGTGDNLHGESPNQQ